MIFDSGSIKLITRIFHPKKAPSNFPINFSRFNFPQLCSLINYAKPVCSYTHSKKPKYNLCSRLILQNMGLSHIIIWTQEIFPTLGESKLWYNLLMSQKDLIITKVCVVK